jgi:GntR family transcriptional regulator
MEIVIDIDDPEPLFGQLVAQVKQAVQGGKLRPGDALPSIRQLAGDLELNSKTVAKAYRLLERDSVIQTRGYRGTFIHPEARANSKVDLGVQAHDTLARAVATLRDAGVTDSEIRIAFSSVMGNRNQGARQS